LPAEVAEHETVALPEPVTLLGVIESQTRPEGTMSARVTFPAKPFKAFTVIVEVAETPTLTRPGDVAIITKSWTRKIAKAECVRVPLVPLTMRV
jgi:hypothetical protein